MIKRLIIPKLIQLNSISPSQYYSALSCPYKIVLANSFGYKSLLPLNANAYFGSIIHKMIELISKGVICDDQTFTENWTNLLTLKETELKEKGITNILPLKYFVTDFALKKNQIRNIFYKKQEKLNHSQKFTKNKFFTEKRLENSDKSIIGFVDLIIENDLGTTILDFKSGKVYENEIEESGVAEQLIKKEYEVQLKLYAHLYYLMTNKYPNALFIITLSNDYIEVKFKNIDCENIYLEALNFLTTINSFIAKNEINAIANPSVLNCKYCSYRPACKFYLIWLSNNFETVNDIYGTVDKVNQFNNNTIGLQLYLNDKRFLINGFTNESKINFEKLIGKNILIFNLKKTKLSLNATANNFTIVYE
jgi:CRISPR/Cas system-associated exonuclease Cas4 (RecB family)